jgi:hypothetical protein
VPDEQPAVDVPDRAELAFGRLDHAGADVVSEPEVAAGGIGLAGPGLRAALLVLGVGIAEFVVVDPCAGDIGLLAGGVASASLSCSWTRSSMKAGSTTHMPAAQSRAWSCTQKLAKSGEVDKSAQGYRLPSIRRRPRLLADAVSARR